MHSIVSLLSASDDVDYLHDWANEARPLSLWANLELRGFGQQLILESATPQGRRYVEAGQSRALLAYVIEHKPNKSVSQPDI